MRARNNWAVATSAMVLSLTMMSSVAYAEEDPTAPPSPTPSAAPTVKPTATPTAKPTAKPSTAPTVKPTVKPSAGPTVKPSVTASTAPSPSTTTSSKPQRPRKTRTPAPALPPPVPQAHTVQQGPSFPLWGVDVSRWQHPDGGALEWPAIAGAAQGFAFTFVKASEGAGTQGVANLYYDTDVLAARAAGAFVGAYHYAGPGLPVLRDARTEARHAVASAGRPGPGDLPLVLDLESNPDGLSPEELSAWALAWLKEVELLTGRRPIFYTYPTFFTANVYPDPALGEYPLWIANYGLAVDEPSVPAPWSSWTFWQHSAEGMLPGTLGYIDLNVFAGSRAELALLAGQVYSGVGVDATGVSLLGDTMLTAMTTGD